MNTVTKLGAGVALALVAAVGGVQAFGEDAPTCAYAAVHMTCEQAAELPGFEAYAATCEGTEGRVGFVAELKGQGSPPMPEGVTLIPELLLHPSSITPIECPEGLEDARLVPPEGHYPHAIAGEVRETYLAPSEGDPDVLEERTREFVGRCIAPGCECVGTCTPIVPWEPMGSDTWRVPFCKALPDAEGCTPPDLAEVAP